MKLQTFAAIGAFVSAMSAPLSADERPDHYEGKPAETLQQAVSHFSDYNAKLEAILAKDPLSARDLNDIHQLTYTLENALETINREFTALANVLEEVHVASETAGYDRVKEKGQAYLETARQLVE